jgi:hypothetical protein
VRAVQLPGIQVRAGVHAGECEVLDGKLVSVAVHVGVDSIEQWADGMAVLSSPGRRAAYRAWADARPSAAGGLTRLVP